MYTSVMLATSLLYLAISGVASYNYQDVGLCPNIYGDPKFSITPSLGTRVIYATTSASDAVSDRCAIIKSNVFYVTGKDSSFTIVKFKGENTLSSGSFTQYGPDGNRYEVIALKAYGSECNHMNLILRCSDFVGDIYKPPQVKIHANIGEKVSDWCLHHAEAYAESVLGEPITFHLLDNTNCKTFDDYLLITN